MSQDERLRILIANEKVDRLKRLASVVEGLGHEVVARSVVVSDVAAATARERPDAALVGLGDSSEHAFEMVSEIVREAYCPVIAVLHTHDMPWVNEAAKRGLYAYVVDGTPAELQSALDITLRRFADVQSLQHAIERRTSETRRDKDLAAARQQQALELHDGVVQGIVTAKLAQDLGHVEASRAALEETLQRAKAVVSRSMRELRDSGMTTGQAIQSATADDDDA